MQFSDRAERDKFCETPFLELCALSSGDHPCPVHSSVDRHSVSPEHVLVWQWLQTVVEVTVLIGEWVRDPLLQVTACTSSALPVTILILKYEPHTIMGVRRLCRN